MNDVIIKIGVTPSMAPFRISNLRTFIYVYSILLSYKFKNHNCKMIFQIDDTNESKRKYSDEEIISFYKKIGILNNEDGIEKIITKQKDNTKICQYYYEELEKRDYIIINSEGVSYFNIKKYVEEYGDILNVNDLIYKNITFDINNLSKNGLLAIRRSDGTFLYHFASCIDNLNLGLTHIVRGNNKITSSAYQVMLMKCLNISMPTFVHLPLLLEKNDRKSIYELIKNDFDFQPIISYLISSGYGDSNKVYYDYYDFAKNIDIQQFHKKNGYLDLNILRKNQIRYYNNVSYDKYLNNIIVTAFLDGYLGDLNLMEIFYKHKFNYSNIRKYQQLSFEHQEFEKITHDEFELVKKIIPLLESEITLNEIMYQLPNENNKNVYEMIQWIFTGRKSGTSANILLDIYMNSGDKSVAIRKVKKLI